MNRRDVIKTGILASGCLIHPGLSGNIENVKPTNLKGNIRHAVCQWTYDFLSIDDLCILSKDIGIEAIDLVEPGDWDTVKRHGLTVSMCSGAEIGLTKGWNDTQYHTTLIQRYTDYMPGMTKAGFTNLICFSGNRGSIDDEIGLNNCVDGLRKILPMAEKLGITIHMEILNSKVDHKGYMCDKNSWGIELCKRLDSPNFKLLFDIYHVQIMEGDIIRNIRQHAQYYGHYHTAGVPGRNELDQHQELYYPAIMQAIHQTGFKGYVAQEFMSKFKDTEAKKQSLRDAIYLCDI